jgi:hypothetical protein
MNALMRTILPPNTQIDIGVPAQEMEVLDQDRMDYLVFTRHLHPFQYRTAL